MPATHKRFWPFTWMESPYFIPLYMNLLWFVQAIAVWDRSKLTALAFIVCIGASVLWVLASRRGRSWQFYFVTIIYLVSLGVGMAGLLCLPAQARSAATNSTP